MSILQLKAAGGDSMTTQRTALPPLPPPKGNRPSDIYEFIETPDTSLQKNESFIES